MTTVTTRNAELADLISILKDQDAQRLDVVAPAAALRSRQGNLVIKGAEVDMTEAGVTQVDGTYRISDVMVEGFADKLGIPVGYLRRLKADAPDLFDANINGWLHGKRVQQADGGTRIDRDADPRKFLARLFRGQVANGDVEDGLGRALLSDRFGILDNYDFALAALAGVKNTGLDVGGMDIKADLSERRMYIRVTAPQVSALAPTLLRGYRSPFSGAEGSDNPTVWGGFVLSNSEVGAGAWTVTPRLVVQICNNGHTINKDAIRGVHLGGKLDEGIIQWSRDTERKTLELVTSKVTDVVRTFLTPAYLEGVIADLEAQAGVPLATPTDTIEFVSKKLGFTKDEAQGILADFITGGQVTAGGVMQAVTAFAQRVTDADEAANLEAKALDAMALAASHR